MTVKCGLCKAVLAGPLSLVQQQCCNACMQVDGVISQAAARAQAPSCGAVGSTRLARYGSHTDLGQDINSTAQHAPAQDALAPLPAACQVASFGQKTRSSSILGLRQYSVHQACATATLLPARHSQIMTHCHSMCSTTFAAECMHQVISVYGAS